jgi:AraC-like DNA-binding protein
MSTSHVFGDVPDVDRPVIAYRADYPDAHTVPPHHHGRHQLLYGASGVVMVTTAEGAWVMPPQRGMWIPASVTHSVRMFGEVRTNSLYFRAGAVERMPDHCQVLGVSPFMRALLAEAVQLPREYALEGREGALMDLLRHEVGRLRRLPLSLPFPAHEGLARLCRGLLREPNVHETIDAWSEALGMNRRTFTRLFKRETGLSFMTWRQQACVVMALPRLASGETVTSIAMEFGYDNPAAFTAMFQRALGAPPKAYLRSDRDPNRGQRR